MSLLLSSSLYTFIILFFFFFKSLLLVFYLSYFIIIPYLLYIYISNGTLTKSITKVRNHSKCRETSSIRQLLLGSLQKFSSLLLRQTESRNGPDHEGTQVSISRAPPRSTSIELVSGWPWPEGPCGQGRKSEKKTFYVPVHRYNHFQNPESKVKTLYERITNMRITMGFRPTVGICLTKYPPKVQSAMFAQSQWSVTNGGLRHWRWFNSFSSSHFKSRPFDHYWYFSCFFTNISQ